ncbi:MAG: hypothetical protein P1U89_22610 [Verrucomicrobiales bacterium]|nr:hypothetical protein [Verrucomicrobiales bacterium]
MFHGRTIAVFLILMTLGSVQGQDLRALPVDGNSPDNQPGGMVPVEDDTATLIDLTGEDSPTPVDAAGASYPQTGPENIGSSSRMSGRISRSRVVEEYKPEKFKVYPDDPDSAVWETNVRYAFHRAQREMKPLLLLFTSMTNQAAMNLSQQVFATKSFNNFVKENLVICYLNYPMNIKDAPRSMQWAKKEFKVAGYPSVLIFNPNGEVDRSIRGYREGRPVDYFNDLKSACAPTLATIKNRKESLYKVGFRDWRNAEGRGIFAKFVRRDDYLMTLIDAKGKEWTVAINQLSGEDRMMAMSFPRLDQVQKSEQR